MPGRKRLAVAGALLALAVAAPAAQAAVPDTWTRWAKAPQDTAIRSLDWAAGGLYAAGDGAGVFWSTNPFGPWQEKTAGLEAPNAKAVRQVKASPNGLLYSATSAGLFSAQPGDGAWSPVGQGEGADKLNMGGIQAIMFNDPSGMDMTVAVAGAAGPGVYNSADGGATWKRAAGMPQGENVFHLTAPPAGTPMYAAADDGVFVSLDFGRNWTLMADGIPPGEMTLRVEVSPVDPSRLYASTSSSVYRFVPAKLAWDEIDGAEEQYLPVEAKKGMIIAPPVSGQPGDKRAITATRYGVYATIDDGDHWREMSQTTLGGARPMDHEDVATVALGPGTLMAGTGYGVFTLPLQPLELASITITEPAGGMAPGKMLTTTTVGLGGTKPHWLTYQWYRCPFNTAGCQPTEPIPGETRANLMIPTEDANESNTRYRVTVVGRNIVSPEPITKSDDTVAGVGGTPADAPQPKSGHLPTMSPGNGAVPTPVFGQEYTLGEGEWQSSNFPDLAPVFSYKWQRCNAQGSACVEIAGAYGKTYKTTPEDIGKKVEGFVRATNMSNTSDWYRGGTSATVINMKPVNEVAPKVVGEPVVGQTLSSSAGGWLGHDMSFTRRWFRCEADGLGCNPVFPAVTSPTYPLTAADLGKRLAIEVTAIGADPENVARTATVLSAPSEVIVNPPSSGGGGGGGGEQQGGETQVPPPTVKISAPRKLKPGVKITVPKAFKGFTNPRYRWLRNGKKIKRATKRAYTLTRKDRGKRISCRIKLTPAAGGTAIVVKTKALRIPR